MNIPPRGPFEGSLPLREGSAPGVRWAERRSRSGGKCARGSVGGALFPPREGSAPGALLGERCSRLAREVRQGSVGRSTVPAREGNAPGAPLGQRPIALAVLGAGSFLGDERSLA